MKVKIAATLITLAVLYSWETLVYAQSPITKTDSNFTLHGNSLVNIDQRNTEDDFGKFFAEQDYANISPNRRTKKAISHQLPFNQSLSFPDDTIILQPAFENANENDGLKVQLDVGTTGNNQ